MEGYIMEILGVIGLGLVGAGIKMANSWLQANTDLKISNELKGEIMDGVKWGKRQAKKKLGNAADQVDFDNEAIQQAYDYVMQKAPKWL